MIMMLLLSFLPTAQAYSCGSGLVAAVPRPELTDIHPEDIPANLLGMAWYRSTHLESSDWKLVGLDNDETHYLSPTALEDDSGAEVRAWSAEAPLNGSYRLEIDYVMGEDELSFEVQGGIDENPPAVPVVLSTERIREEISEWGLRDRLTITYAPPAERVWYRVESARDDHFSDSTTVLSSGAEHLSRIGSSPCGGSHSPEELDRTTHLRITAIDLAGNESEALVMSVDTSLEHAAEAPASKLGCSSVQPISRMMLCWGLLCFWRRGSG